jgi:BASS family bile acid:Na+ symporter
MCEERTLAVLVLASGIFIGLGVPSVADLLRPWALPALFLVIVFSLVPFARLPAQKMFAIDREMVRVVLWQQVVLPCIVIAAAIVARFPDWLILLLIVTVCSGSLFSSPALAEILGLDRETALRAMVLSTLFMPVSLFLFLSVFVGEKADLDLVAYGIRTLIFLVLPFGVLALIRPFARAMDEQTTQKVGFVSRWATIAALLVFGTGLMSSVADKLAENPPKVVLMLAMATVICILMMTLTTIVMYRFGHSQALTASIVAGFRNIGLGFALVGEMAGPDLAVYAGISLVPVFIAPLLLKVSMLRRVVAGQPLEQEKAGDAHSPFRAG